MSHEKDKGEAFHVLSRPANMEVLSKAAWYNDFMAMAEKPPARPDAICMSSMVYEFLKLALWKYGEVFLKAEHVDGDVFLTVATPDTVTPLVEDGELVGYYEGKPTGDLSGVKTYQPEDILHIKGTA